MKIRIGVLLLALAALVAMSGTQLLAEPKTKVVLASEVKWEQLNPARGDQSPLAATLWGDRNGSAATGFLFRSVDGFRSPPHIHNVSYRGVVIQGVIHNDDPQAEELWMPAGSYWTQPKGGVHITAAKGADILAYIEIEEGPYLVRPVSRKFDSGEVPVNIHRSNLVWLDGSNIEWLKASGPEVAFLWGDPQEDSLSGTLLKLPAGFRGTLVHSGPSLQVVMIQGTPEYTDSGRARKLEPGSYFCATGSSRHELSSKDEECILYLRSRGEFQLESSALE